MESCKKACKSFRRHPRAPLIGCLEAIEEGLLPGDDLPELVPLATRVTEHLRRAVKARAALEGRSVQDLVSQALMEYLENHDEPERSPAASPVTPRT